MDSKALCMIGGCAAAGSHPCTYVDRDGVECDTVWCSAHIRLFAGEAYCRRHASTMAALAHLRTADGLPPPRPPLPNRGASLVRWLAREMDAPIRELLEGCRRDPEDRLVVDGRTELPDNVHGSWVWRWAMVNADTGANTTVTLSVEESRDDFFTVRVGDVQVYSATPPWVAHRRNHESVSSAVDAQEREDQMQAVVHAIDEEISSRR